MIWLSETFYHATLRQQKDEPNLELRKRELESEPELSRELTPQNFKSNLLQLSSQMQSLYPAIACTNSIILLKDNRLKVNHFAPLDIINQLLCKQGTKAK